MRTARLTSRVFIACVCVWLAAFTAAPLAAQSNDSLHADAMPQDPDAASLIIPLDGRDQTLVIARTPNGHAVIVDGPLGKRALSPEQFVDLIYRDQLAQRQKFLFKLFNITSWVGVLWVGVGLLGQAMFTFRMVLQWLVSEKHGRSIIPVGFWWGSLIGGLMLLSYFVWRKDIVGIIGQSTGAFIYARNLVLIYRHRALPTETVVPSAPSDAEALRSR